MRGRTRAPPLTSPQWNQHSHPQLGDGGTATPPAVPAGGNHSVAGREATTAHGRRTQLDGPVAQSVARCCGTTEVRGSSPLWSTYNTWRLRWITLVGEHVPARPCRSTGKPAHALVAQRTERHPTEVGVAGSNPVEGTHAPDSSTECPPARWEACTDSRWESASYGRLIGRFDSCELLRVRGGRQPSARSMAGSNPAGCTRPRGPRRVAAAVKTDAPPHPRRVVSNDPVAQRLERGALNPCQREFESHQDHKRTHVPAP